MAETIRCSDCEADVPGRAAGRTERGTTLGTRVPTTPRKGRGAKLHDLPLVLRMVWVEPLDDRYLYFFGGYFASPEQARKEAQDFGFSSDAWIYDLKQDRYSKAPRAMPVRIAGAAFCRRGESIYSAGGEDRNYSRSARTVIGSVQRGQAMQRNSE